MTDFLELTGRNEEEAIKSALETLGLPRDEVRIEVVHRAKTGFMGFGAKPAKVKIHYQRPQREEPKEEATPVATTPVVPTPVPATPVVTTPVEPRKEEVTPVEMPSVASPSVEATPVATPLVASPPVSPPPVVTTFVEAPIEVTTATEPQNSTISTLEAPKVENAPSLVSQEEISSIETSKEQQPETAISTLDTPQVENSTPENPVDSLEAEPKATQWADLTEEKQSTEKPMPRKSRKSKKEKEFNLQEKEEISQATEAFLQGMVERLKVEVTIQIDFRGEVVIVHLEGKEVSSLIGRRGDTLDAIQQLTTYVVQKNCKKRLKVWIDAENYRAKREETLVKLAEKMAGQAVKHRRNVPMESMNAYERHIIHETLSDYPKVYTYSTGSEPNRRIVVAFQGNEQQSHQGHKKKQKRTSHYDRKETK